MLLKGMFYTAHNKGLKNRLIGSGKEMSGLTPGAVV
jgi:hypothetical protein